ncbi:T9SS type B sorting domain-containing protein [Flavisericum labens]|uniref:T9SS type B sorting domain-containing protein n=1 Tax=Flavisericum labens TaxID=3377112 RepID=UPI00387AA7DD
MNLFKHLLLFPIIFVGVLDINAQKETNIWYFGEYAGLDFNSGIPVPLSDGKLDTGEGCATICDKNGNLLFYTDGVTVWNRNHEVMLNGTWLGGDSSSTHSALIVPKPESDHIYYIFTADSQGRDNGFQYSEVDMQLSGGMGGITSNKNIELYNPTTEKITAVKGCNGDCFWVITHKMKSSEFLAYKVTSSGVDKNPVISDSGTFITTGLEAIGAIKISPNGKKLAVANEYLNVEIFDFDSVTGKIQNPVVLLDAEDRYYGIEFSPNNKLLYVGQIEGGITQFNIEAGSTAEIINSKTEIIDDRSGDGYAALQLAVDGKIYVAKFGKYIDVIDAPNILGAGCNYLFNEIYLTTGTSQMGLPPFIQSYFFIEDITFENICLGDRTKFSLNETVESIFWDFGDPDSGTNNTSKLLEPTHIFTDPGTYEVTTTATLGLEIITETTTVTIQAPPNVNSTVNLIQCDEDTDGFSFFNLNEVIPRITTNTTENTISFYENQADAEVKDNPISNTVAYENQMAHSDIIWARVENPYGCYSTVQVNLKVNPTQIPNTFSRDFYICDDNNDGISTFDFSSVDSEIRNLFPSDQQIIISYYKNETEALAENNPIVNISNYTNNNSPHIQHIYVRVDGVSENDCLGFGDHINLHVVPQPIANAVTLEAQCDNDGDGMFSFDISEVQSTVIGNQSVDNTSVSYFDENNNPLPSPLPNPFLTGSQTISIRVTNPNVSDGSCYAETSLEFVVNEQPIAYTVPDQILCDDDAINDDGIMGFDTSAIENTLLNGQTGMDVRYYDKSGAELPSPLPNPFVTNAQSIIAEVINPKNTICTSNTEIKFIVNPLPKFTIDTPQIVCSSDPTFTVVLDPKESNTSETYDYEWTFEDGSILSSDPKLTVSMHGTYSVSLTKTDGTGCSRTRNIFVDASELATITHDDITVVDNSNNNSISINTTNLGQGDYEFALDDEFGNYQDEPFFDGVSTGIHTLYVRDKKGCGTSFIDVSVIGFPKFFTPNNDGINDFWQVYGVNRQFQSQSDISIFDRYGKLVKQLAPASKGWDGTYVGNPLPVGDYWFRVLLQDGRTFLGHFTLKR